MSDKLKSKGQEKAEFYAVDTSIGLVVFSLGIAFLGVLVLVYFTRRSGVFNVTPRATGANVNVNNRQPQMLQRPGANRRREVAPQFIAGEEGVDMMVAEDSDDESLEGIAESIRATSGKIGVKKMKKLEMKEEKRRMREAEVEMRAERAKREADLEEQRQEEAAREAAEEAKREEELKAAEEERRRTEHEEYLQLKAAFNVEEEGFEADQSEAEVQHQLQMFIDHVKCNKVVNIEELASCFNMRSADCVSRLKSLQESEQITGILDDRGKFIYVSDGEMRDLAKFISQRGRISISELATAATSRNIISLKPVSSS